MRESYISFFFSAVEYFEIYIVGLYRYAWSAMHYLRYLIPFALFAVVNGDKNNDGQPTRLRMPPVLRPPFPLGPMPRPFPAPGGFSTSNNGEPDDQGGPLAACGPYAGSCPEGLCCSSSGT